MPIIFSVLKGVSIVILLCRKTRVNLINKKNSDEKYNT